MIPAMVTPFDENLDLDLKQARALARRLVENGADALIINGTTGESPTVFYSPEDEALFFEAVVSEIDGEVPVIANVGDNCTADTVDFARDVQKLGVDGFMLRGPLLQQASARRSLSALQDHRRKHRSFPCVLLRRPSVRCVINMTAETTLRLANEVDNIVAIKEASGNLEQVAAILAGAPEGFEVYSGDDALTYDIMKLGGAGVISTIGNVAPDRMKEIVDLCAAGDFEAATKANEALLPLMNELFITSNPIMVKEALNLLGFPVGGVRLPLVNATAEQSAELAEVMRQVGVLK